MAKTSSMWDQPLMMTWKRGYKMPPLSVGRCQAERMQICDFSLPISSQSQLESAPSKPCMHQGGASVPSQNHGGGGLFDPLEVQNVDISAHFILPTCQMLVSTVSPRRGGGGRGGTLSHSCLGGRLGNRGCPSGLQDARRTGFRVLLPWCSSNRTAKAS